MDSINGDSTNKRASNFSSVEELLLITLVKKYANQIENKRTDGNTNKTKNAAWIQLSREFNSLSGEAFRCVLALKNKHRYGTGGGPPINFNDTNVDSEIKEIIGSQMTGFESEFDNDHLNDGVGIVEEEQVTAGHDAQQSRTLEEHDSSAAGENDWGNFSAENLRAPISSKLKPKENTRKRGTREGGLKTKLGNWAKSKQDFLTAQQQAHVEECQQKLKDNEEKHQAEMAREGELHKQTLQMRKEEHEIKVSILMLKKQKLLKELSK